MLGIQYKMSIGKITYFALFFAKKKKKVGVFSNFAHKRKEVKHIINLRP
jgi:hypothetical protein